MIKKHKNRLKLAKVIVKNKMSRFLWFNVYMALFFPLPSTLMPVRQCMLWGIYLRVSKEDIWTTLTLMLK